MPLRLIILDRDGVINKDRDDYVKSPEEFLPLPGSLEAITALKKSGYLVAIATNQSGLARGYFTEAILKAMHEKLNALLAEKQCVIDYIAICPHGPSDECSCRKPKPGMLNEICQALNTHPGEALFIGDSIRDYQAAIAATMPFSLVLTGKGLNTLNAHPHLKDQISYYSDLAACAESLIRKINP